MNDLLDDFIRPYPEMETPDPPESPLDPIDHIWSLRVRNWRPAVSDESFPDTTGGDDARAEDWNRRARENARWYIASDVKDDEEFTRSGEPDVDFALRGLDPQWLGQVRALEIGCAVGRMTHFFLRRVWSLCAIDVSSEMIAQAAGRLGRNPNLQLLATNGCDLSVFADGYFDLALSYIVFQHIPNSIVRRYFREIHRVLRPGGIFRGQVARLHFPGFLQPPDSDTFSMRSWEPEEVRSAFGDWGDVDLEVIPVTDTTDHIWITAMK